MKNKLKTTIRFFSERISFLGLALLVCVMAVSCERYEPQKDDPPIVYPIEIPFTELKIPQWASGNIKFDNTVIIINNEDELKDNLYYSVVKQLYPEIDFSTHSLLVANGTNNLGIYEKEAKSLWQLSSDKYELNVELKQLPYAEVVDKWFIPLLVEKIDSNSTIKLNVTTSTVEMKVCGVDNPLTDLPWLKEIIETHNNSLVIYQCNYKNGIGFLVCFTVGMSDSAFELMNCEGTRLCLIGGYSALTCPEFEVDFGSVILIWENI